MTSAQVMPEAYSLTVPSGSVMLMRAMVSVSPSTPTGLNPCYQSRACFNPPRGVLPSDVKVVADGAGGGGEDFLFGRFVILRFIVIGRVLG